MVLETVFLEFFSLFTYRSHATQTDNMNSGFSYTEDPALISRLSPSTVDTAISAKGAERSCCSKLCAALWKPFRWCFKSIAAACSAESSKSLMLAMFYLLGEVLLSIALIINWHTKTDGILNIREGSVEGLMVTYMAIGIIGMLVVFKKGSNTNFVIFTTNEKQASKYLMGSVYAFGGGSLFMTTVYLFTFAHCKEQASHILFNLVRFLYTLIQMLLLQRFSLAIFHRSAGLVFLMIHILGTNICVWIYYLVEETKLFNYEPRDIQHEECMSKNNVAKMAEEWNEYLLPFSMEFCLICAGLIYSMISSMKHFPKSSKETTHSHPRHHDYASLHDATISQPLSVIEGLQDDERARARWQKQLMSKKVEPYTGAHPGFLCGVTVSVIMVVSALVLENTGSVDLYNSLICHHILLIGVSVSQIVALGLVLMSLQDHEYVQQNFRSDDTLLVISFSGLFGWELLCIISAIGSFAQPYYRLNEAVVIFIHNVINLTSCLVQCAVIIRTLRFRNRLKSNKTHLLWSKSTMDFKMFWLSQAVVYLLMTNVGFWVLDSFFELKHSGDLYYPVGRNFYKYQPWHFWSSMLYPLFVFYRFHSATLLVEIWVRFGKEAKDGGEEEPAAMSRQNSLPSIDRFLFTKQESKVAKKQDETWQKTAKRKPYRDPSDIYRKYWSK